MQVRMYTTTCTHTCAHAHRHRLHFGDVRTHHCQSFSSVLLWKERKSLIRRGITSTVFHCNWFIPVCLPQCVWKTYGLLWSEVEGIFLIERKGIFRLHLKLSWRFMHLYDGSFISLYIFCVHFITWCKTHSAIFTSNISIIDHESFLCAVIQCLQSIFCYIVLLTLGFGCHNQEETEVTGDINLAERFWWWTRWNQRKLNTLANWGCFFFHFFFSLLCNRRHKGTFSACTCALANSVIEILVFETICEGRDCYWSFFMPQCVCLYGLAYWVMHLIVGPSEKKKLWRPSCWLLKCAVVMFDTQIRFVAALNSI